MAKKVSNNPAGGPPIWEEAKKRVNMTLTPKAVTGLDTLAGKWKLSRSELVERIGRGIIEITSPPERDN
jgi:metal-responsive CopG/Arc/MetJ family transcriptional regulator